MDPLDALLTGPRAHGAFLLRSSLAPPWSIRVRDEAPLTLVAVAGGHAWVLPAASDPVRLAPGDVAVLRGPDEYTVADEPGTEPQAVIHPGQRCTAPDGTTPYPMTGPRSWGNSPDGGCVLITGTYQVLSEVCGPLLAALPPVVHVPECTSPLVGLLATEVERDEPGQEAVLDRLLDLLLVAVLRDHLSRPGHEPPPWYRAQSDPVVGPVLRLLHDDPAAPWTVSALAAEVHVSRAALARRFTELMGQPPMGYLTQWRLGLAADLLREPDATVAGVAARVGYSTAFALSTAFKRVRGISPREHRERAAASHPPVAAPGWRRLPA
ncbi:AraC family transcriptional regulator [Actinocatenispora thailandica]|uniref:AraC family transcriptional regulator n=1 Tax=Actinocatenispora thailandica TaxID=227318 RepID=A0A7R7HYP0_9ACTN|nr:AraC family transcriptional regulator [Actinocatenispora thailandica]BCJ36454.1 AraC family transcriptional regulator [Actinocatenispora thailandica]